MTTRFAAISVLLFSISALVGCTETPVKSKTQSFTIDKSISATHDAVIEYFIFMNYRLDENSNQYIKAFEYSKGTGMYGDHGDFVHVWLSTTGNDQTLVQVDVTSKGYVWDSERDGMVIKRIKRYLNLPATPE